MPALPGEANEVARPEADEASRPEAHPAGHPVGDPVGAVIAPRSAAARHRAVTRPEVRPVVRPVRPTGAPTGRVRRGLVLGGGGVLGSAWMIGALRAYETATGIDARTFDVVVGTSAGAVLAALIGHGIPTSTMVDQQRGIIAPDTPTLDYSRMSATVPPAPRLRLGSMRLLAASARNPRSVTPLVALAAVLPPGRGTMEPVAELVAAAAARAGGGWPRGPTTWIVAMDYATGARVAFGRPGAPEADLPRAVVASCAIPGWYEPVRIGDRSYVDGGARSATSLDLLATEGLTEVLVLAPAASFEYDHPRHPGARLERRFRRSVTRHLVREAALVRAAGTRVTMLGPGRDDLEVIGANLMDVARIPAVLETSLRTSAAALAVAAARPTAPAPPADLAR